MSGEPSGLTRRLAEITTGFFQATLGLNPKRVHVLDEIEDGDLIVIKVEGFMTEAEAALAERHEDQRLLGEYYARVLERLSPTLRVAVEGLAQRPLLRCRTTLDLSADQCLYLLSLGRRIGEESLSSRTAGESK